MGAESARNGSPGLSDAPEAADRILYTEQCRRLSDADRSQLRQAVNDAHKNWHSAHDSDPLFFWLFLFWPAVFVFAQWRVNRAYFGLGFSWKTIVDPVLALCAGLLIVGTGAYLSEAWGELVVMRKIWTRFPKDLVALLRRRAKKIAKVECAPKASRDLFARIVHSRAWRSAADCDGVVDHPLAALCLFRG